MKDLMKKLSQARIDLQALPLKKSGKNTFQGYSYFELGDFLPSCNEVLHKQGLCAIVNFHEHTATLTIYSHSSDESVEFSSPVASAAVAKSLPIQALGAQQTYLRRYLWMNAMEIVESDAVDCADQNKVKPVETISAEQSKALQAAIKDSPLTLKQFLTASRLKNLTDMHASRLERALDWVNNQGVDDNESTAA